MNIIWDFFVVPAGPPYNSTFVSENATSITADINLPELRLRNGIITEYSLTIFNEELSYTSSVSLKPDISGRSIHIFHDLKAFTWYNLTVTAATKFGHGPVLKIDVQTEETGNILYCILFFIVTSFIVFYSSL